MEPSASKPGQMATWRTGGRCWYRCLLLLMYYHGKYHVIWCRICCLYLWGTCTIYLTFFAELMGYSWWEVRTYFYIYIESILMIYNSNNIDNNNNSNLNNNNSNNNNSNNSNNKYVCIYIYIYIYNWMLLGQYCEYSGMNHPVKFIYWTKWSIFQKATRSYLKWPGRLAGSTCFM